MMKKFNLRKVLKQLLKEYGIRQEDLYYQYGWHFSEVNKELFEDIVRQLDVQEWELNKIIERAYER